jgi:hypothetical protein
MDCLQPENGHLTYRCHKSAKGQEPPVPHTEADIDSRCFFQATGNSKA